MARNGDAEGGKQGVKWAYRCNIVAIVGAVFGWIAVITVVIVVLYILIQNELRMQINRI